MGFRPKRTKYRLLFDDDPELDGLEVTARSAELGVFLDLMGLARKDIEQMGAEEVERLLVRFGELLVDWNVDDPDTGERLPANLTGLRTLEFPLVLSMVNAWVTVLSGAPGPLSRPSSDGEPLEVPSIPMEPLSASQAS
jgi:hypothetical protein